ncbi:ATP-binding protein [Bacillus salipaludis]|uniref:ATP-binding protein n=1 Tax=Bacillus salipaludis TaxID=2547811 RepID=A0AA90TWS8_9BACI|nr:ATP-binding protein [Bacillus salipaludis]MDQ6600978.1 ATP-binding protein [Bacillus salipaludis]
MKSEDQEVMKVGLYLNEIGTNGVAKLMFSDGNVSGISLSEQVNILQIQNLTLPEDGEKPATRDEHIAVALMIPLAKFATKFARDDSKTKITIFEEAWMLTNTGQGHKLIKEMLRTGRSLRSAVYIITQSTLDYNRPDIKEGIGTKFAFKAKTAEEAGNIIEFLGLEDNEANHKMLKNLREGQCIMEDMYGRTAKIQTDVLFNEWVNAFNTKENDKGRAETEEAFM